MSTRIFGSGIRRREDPRLITGSATYIDDITLPGMVHAAMLRIVQSETLSFTKLTSLGTSAAVRSAPTR